MNVYRTSSCCGVGEICELRAHVTPAEALQAFFKLTFRENGTYSGSNLYLFDGVRKWTEGYEVPPRPIRESYKEQAYYPTGHAQKLYDQAVESWKREQLSGYAYAFASYLRKMKLGTIVKAPYRQNSNYKGHLTEAYLWAPDVPRMTKLYTRWTLEGRFEMEDEDPDPDTYEVSLDEDQG